MDEEATPESNLVPLVKVPVAEMAVAVPAAQAALSRLVVPEQALPAREQPDTAKRTDTALGKREMAAPPTERASCFRLSVARAVAAVQVPSTQPAFRERAVAVAVGHC